MPPRASGMRMCYLYDSGRYVAINRTIQKKEPTRTCLCAKLAFKNTACASRSTYYGPYNCGEIPEALLSLSLYVNAVAKVRQR
jgi:hypothetical protein